MAKDVNIHVKTTGAQKAAGDVKQVSQATEEMGAKSSRAAGWLKEAFTALVGPLGITAVVGLAVAGVRKFITALDDMKRASAEAVHELANQQRAANSLFEAMDAYSGPQRKAVLAQARGLQAATGLPFESSMQLLNAYKRTYGDINQPAVQQLAGYWQLHGGASTANLVRWLGASGISDTGRQGQILRLISATAGQTGLEDQEIIENMLRYSTEFAQMGWSPEQAIQNVGRVMSGLAPREARRAMSGLVEGLKTFTEEKAVEMKAPKQIAASEQARLGWAMQHLSNLPPEQQRKFMQQAFGQTYAAYVTKFFTAPTTPEMQQAYEYATTPQAAAEEAAKASAYQETAEGTTERARGGGGYFDLNITRNQELQAAIREYGKKYIEYLKREAPGEYFKIARKNWPFGTEENLYTQAAVALFSKEMSPLEGFQKWMSSSADQRLLGIEQAARTININYITNYNYNPVAGTAADRDQGPRVNRDFK